MTSKTSPKQTTASAGKIDAIKLLTDDHKEVHKMFVQYAKLCKDEAVGTERQPVAEQICMALTVHAAIEEEIFYPEARAAGVAAHLLDEAEVEHASVKELIAQIQGMDPDDALYDAKMTVLSEYVDHHVAEEQDEMFPKCRESAMDLKALGALLAARKAELMAEMSEGMEVA